MASYASLAEFKSWKAIKSTDVFDDITVQMCLDMATAWINSNTGRVFVAANGTRWYDIPYSRTLKLDYDLISVTTLTNGDGTVIPSGQYVLGPRNISPKYEITLIPNSVYQWFPTNTGNTLGVIGVTGPWGYSVTCPDDVKNACISIAVNVYSRRFGEGTMAATVTAAGIVITPQDIDGLTRATMQNYRRVL
jgi:hypothetical protein